jgi:hypothetical protein
VRWSKEGVEGKKRQQRKITEAENSQKILNLNAFKFLPKNFPKLLFRQSLPGSSIIAWAGKMPDMIWIWEVFGLVISFAS